VILMSHFIREVWNVLEDTNNIDNFNGTSKGIVKEVREYAIELQKQFKQQSRITDEKEFILQTIKRDMRE